MKSFAAFLLGLILGVLGMLFLPELAPRREQVSDQMREQIQSLEGQIKALGDQLKNLNLSSPASPSPSPATSPTPQ
jgi:uncharacterized membrane-anchored protein YhcB (DUF1043 family)